MNAFKITVQNETKTIVTTADRATVDEAIELGGASGFEGIIVLLNHIGQTTAILEGGIVEIETVTATEDTLTVKEGTEVFFTYREGDTPKLCKIESIERTPSPQHKEGEVIDSIEWIGGTDGHWESDCIFVISTGQWAYGRQVKPYEIF